MKGQAAWSRWTILAIATALVAACQPTIEESPVVVDPADEALRAAAGVNVTATAQPAQVVANQTVTIELRVTALKETSGDVTLVLSDSDGAQVHSASWQAESLRPASPVDLSSSFLVPAASPTGSYQARVVVKRTGSKLVLFQKDNLVAFSVTSGSTSPICGNGSCESGETCTSCASDCGSCSAVCGNGSCETGETCSSCASDCGACGPICGNGSCETGETCSSCASDCGACGPVCGNGSCETGETCTSCASDCGACGPVCGNGSCETGETCTSCASDCGACQTQSCTDPVFVTSNTNGGWTDGGYYVHNNMWNASSGETLYACSYDNWYVEATYPNTTDVKTYPNVHLDINNLDGAPLSNYATITSTFAGKGPGVGIYNVAYDIWFNGVGWGGGTTEFMIWTENYKQVPLGSKQAAPVFDGITYDAWHYSGGGANVISLVPRVTLPSGTLNLKAMFDWAIGKGWMPSNSTINQICFGVEICSTNSTRQTFTFTDFSVSMAR